ncbi:MAG: hypothetical protein OEU92_18365 [Alphaproteobacteria bacterium]|nr:hypothetical protein [Alphaproteobacteria bacterium]
MNRQQRHYISKIKRLEHDATPAPWAQYGDCIEDAKKIPLITLTKEHFDDRNAEFITELRNAVPALLRLIEQQDREIMRLKGSDRGTIGSAAPRASSLMQ